MFLSLLFPNSSWLSAVKPSWRPWITNSREQSPSWEKLRVTQLVKKFPTYVWSLKFHYHVHKPPPLVPILSQSHLVHTFPHFSSKMHSEIISPSSSLPYVLHTHPSHFPWLDHPNNIGLAYWVMKLLTIKEVGFTFLWVMKDTECKYCAFRTGVMFPCCSIWNRTIKVCFTSIV